MRQQYISSGPDKYTLYMYFGWLDELLSECMKTNMFTVST